MWPTSWLICADIGENRKKERGGGGGLLEGEIPGNPHGRSVVNERSVKYGFTVSWPF